MASLSLGLAMTSYLLILLLYNPRDFNYRVRHRVVVANGLQNGWLKCKKLYLAKIMGSLGWFVYAFQFDPSLQVAVVWQ